LLAEVASDLTAPVRQALACRNGADRRM